MGKGQQQQLSLYLSPAAEHEGDILKAFQETNRRGRYGEGQALLRKLLILGWRGHQGQAFEDEPAAEEGSTDQGETPAVAGEKPPRPPAPATAPKAPGMARVGKLFADE